MLRAQVSVAATAAIQGRVSFVQVCITGIKYDNAFVNLTQFYSVSNLRSSDTSSRSAVAQW